MGFVRDITGQTARKRSEQAARKAAEAQQQGAQTQADYQQQALEYLKQQQQVPSQLRDQALKQLGSMYGLGQPGQPGAPGAPGAGIPMPEYKDPGVGLPEYQKPEMGIPEYQAPGTARPEFGYQGATEAELVQRAQESPLYAAMMGGQAAGEEALLRQAAATGGLRGGNVQGALAQQASDIQRDALLRSYGEQRALEEQAYGRATDQYGRELQGYGLDVGEAERAFGRDLQRYGLGQQEAQQDYLRQLQGYGLGQEAAQQDYLRQLQGYGLQQDLVNRQLAGLSGLAGMDTGAGGIASLLTGIGQTLGAGQAGAGQILSQGKIAGEQARQSALGGLLGMGGKLGGAWLMSDRRLKTNIKRLGDVGPIGWYSWDWLPASGMRGGSAGLLADEVEQIAPEAVITGSDGYKRVDYRAAFAAARGQ